MKISRLGELVKIEPNMEGAENIYKQVPISRDDGTPSFCFRVFTLEPGGHTPFHRHPFEHLNYIIRGSGTVLMEGGKECEVKEGEFVLVLPDEEHQYKNTSTSEPLLFICAVPNEYE